MFRPTIGALSIASGLARFYGLPRHLARALGARDVTIGILMLVPKTAKVATYLRAVSDAVDAVLIARERRDGTLATIARVVAAVGSSLASLAAASRPAR